MVLQCHVCFCPVHSSALFVCFFQCHVLPRNFKFLSNNSFGESSISSFNDMSRFAHSCSASEKLLLRRGPHFLSNKLTFGLISFNVILSRDFSKQQRSHFWLCLFWRHVSLSLEEIFLCNNGLGNLTFGQYLFQWHVSLYPSRCLSKKLFQRCPSKRFF